MAKNMKAALGSAPVFTGRAGYTANDVSSFEGRFWVVAKMHLGAEKEDGRALATTVALACLREKLVDPLAPAQATPATTWYDTAVGDQAPSMTMFEALHVAWAARFLGADVIDRFEAEFQTMRQGTEEEPLVFFNRLTTYQRLVVKGRTPNADLNAATHKKDLHRRLVNGLEPDYTAGIRTAGEDPAATAQAAQEMWRRLEGKRARAGEEAVRVAALEARAAGLEVAMEAMRRSNVPPVQASGRGGRPGGEGPRRAATGRCLTCGSRDHTTNACELTVCWSCKGQGHVAKACPATKGGKNKPSSYAVNGGPVGTRRWVSLFLAGRTVRALIDPGSTTSFLRQDVLAALPAGSWTAVATGIGGATTISGSRMRVLGGVLLEMQLGGSRSRKTLLLVVTGMDEEALLGADVLEPLGVMGAIDKALKERGAKIFYKGAGERVEDCATAAAVATALSPYVDDADVEALETPDLTAKQARRLKDLLRKYRQAFIKPGRYPPPMNVPPQTVEVSGPPVVTPVRPARAPEVREAQEIIELRLLRDDVVEFVDKSRYRAETVMARKDGASPPYRHTIDHSAVSQYVRDDAWPMARVDDQLTILGEKACYVQLDAAHSFFQVPLAEESREMTTFRGALGNMQFKRLPMGLKSSPAIFNRVIEQAFVQKLPSKVRRTLARYVDDFAFGTGKTGGAWDAAVDEALGILETILKAAIEAGLSFKWEKLQLLRREIKFAGLRVSAAGRRARDEKIAAIMKMGEIRTRRQMRSFIGATGALRWQLPRLDELHRPLLATVRGVARSAFKMTPEAERAVEELKRRVAKALTLAIPDPAGEFVVECDTSGDGFGGALFQGGRLVELYSRGATPAEAKMPPLEREWNGVYAVIERWHHLLVDAAKVTIHTDHEPLHGLERNTAIPLKGERGKWMEALRELKNATVVYKPKEEMMLTDFLSRSPAFAKERKEAATKAEVAAVTATTPTRPTLQEWRLKQLADPWLAKIIEWKETHKVHSTDAKEATAIATEAKGMQLVDGVLIKLWKPKSGAGRRDMVEQIVVPAVGGERERILEEMHVVEGKHVGTSALFERVRALYYWDELWADCKRKRARCYTCTERKKISANWDLLQPTTSAMLDGKRRQAIDLFSLKDAEGKQVNVAVVIDVDDGWPYLLLLKTAEAEEWVAQYADRVYANEGLPDELLSDRGSNLNSEFCDAVYKAWGLDKLTTAAGNPMANGRAESLVKRAKDMLIKVLRQLALDGKKLPMERVLPQVEIALRTQYKSPMGTTPFFARYGRDPKLPSYFKQPLVKDQLPPTLEQREEVFRAVMALMDEAAAEAKERYDAGRREHEFRIGDSVWIQDKEAGKTEPQRMGPFRIKEVKGPLDVMIEEINGGPRLGRRHNVINVRQVAKFDVEKWPGQEERTAVRILAHTGGTKNRSYEVLWSDGSKSWEPSRNLIDYGEADDGSDLVTEALLRYWDAHPRMAREAK
jgi:hypothetical protein